MSWEEQECFNCGGELEIGWDGEIRCKDCEFPHSIDDDGNLFVELYDMDEFMYH